MAWPPFLVQVGKNTQSLHDNLCPFCGLVQLKATLPALLLHTSTVAVNLGQMIEAAPTFLALSHHLMSSRQRLPCGRTKNTG